MALNRKSAVTFEAGQRLGSYEILEKIGSGGMGDVFKARDVRLDRLVAIKVLTSELANTPTRRERLKREAKAISRLSHPNVCTLLDVGEHDEAYFLVLEYIEGRPLSQDIARGALPLRDALRIGAEVADGLAAAHREGIVHRDLKPGNIMLTRTGVKILDFGLARFGATEESGDEDSPTLSRPLTSEGVVVGTPSYMAPEQIVGESIDARADLFALGIVLYEMIAGRTPFRGESTSAVTASILKDEPSRLDSPTYVRHVVETCLAKAPDARWQGAADLARELRWLGSREIEAPHAASPSAFRWGPWLLAVLVGVAALTLRGRESGPELEALSLAPPPGESFRGLQPALSPDGRQFAFMSSDDEGRRRLWGLDLPTAESRVLAEAGNVSGVVFTRGGHELMWSNGGQDARTLSLQDGVERVIFRGSAARGLARNDDGVLLIVPDLRSALYRGSEGGEEAQLLTELDRDAGETSHRHPQFLPDGDHFIFFVLNLTMSDSAVHLGSLSEGKLARLVDSTSPALHADGHLFFVQDGVLLVQRFDIRSRTLSGVPTPIAQNVGAPAGFPANVAVSENGVLAYGPNLHVQPPRRLVWYDRAGTELGELGAAEAYEGISLSKDDGRVAATISEGTNAEIWVVDSRGVATRITSSPSADGSPVWSPSGDRLLFSSARAGSTRDLYVHELAGASPPKLLVESDDILAASDWDNEGRLWGSQRRTTVGLATLAGSGESGCLGMGRRSVTRVPCDGTSRVLTARISGRPVARLRFQ